MQLIIEDCLSLRKHYSRWMSHKLIDEQKDRRVDWCRFIMGNLTGAKKNDCETTTPYGALKENEHLQNVAVREAHRNKRSLWYFVRPATGLLRC
ncbi:hypothetical protein EVAR_47973_1 [Eumeta japonica]|uniref:Uncharacterized protein n=1 Tax=Eumeta variegata TaxID=151549 RepID=A0A4C1XAK1_EUMVA|nr:hypothetical protein EVAR_47973_1 [Eumeta japonica]